MEQRIVPVLSMLIGMATGFVVRDELNMPTYMRIKIATVEHRVLARSKLNKEVLTLLDPNEGRYQLTA